MAKKILTKQTQTLDAHSSLGDRPNINDGLDPTQLKAQYDRDVNRNKTYLNDTLTEELQSETSGDSGGHAIGLGVVGVVANNVGDAILELLTAINLRQLVSNLVTTFQVTPDNTHYPSEKLVKDSLDLKADTSNVLTRNNTDVFTPDADYEPSTKKYADDVVNTLEVGQVATNASDISNLNTTKADKTNVLELNNTTPFTPNADYEPATKKFVDDEISGVVLGQIPDNSLTNVKLETDIKVGSLSTLLTTEKSSITSSINEVYKLINSMFDSWTNFDGYYYLSLKDTPSIGDWTEEIRLTSDDSLYASRVSLKNNPSIGDWNIRITVASLGIQLENQTLKDNPTAGSWRQNISTFV